MWEFVKYASNCRTSRLDFLNEKCSHLLHCMIFLVDLAQESPGVFYGNAFARGTQSASYNLTLQDHDR